MDQIRMYDSQALGVAHQSQSYVESLQIQLALFLMISQLPDLVQHVLRQTRFRQEGRGDLTLRKTI